VDDGSSSTADATAIERLPGTVARMMLGRRLQELRQEAGIHAEDAALHAGVARATLWRIEIGDLRCRYKPGDVEVLGRLYEAKAEMALLGSLVLATRNNRTGLPGEEGQLPGEIQQRVDLESHACRIRCCAPYLVPDLLSDTGYLTAVLQALPGRATADLAALVNVQPHRQRFLTASGPQPTSYEFVIDEAVLHRPVGSLSCMLTN
jgi:transcriptional regulator with XRE-family HTH domain